MLPNILQVFFLVFILGTVTLPVNISIGEMNSTSILVQWDILRPCSDSESGIGLYSHIQSATHALSSKEVENVDITGKWMGEEAEIRLTGLTPYTSYSIRIATINEEGDVEHYSYPIQIVTNEDGRQ